MFTMWIVKNNPRLDWDDFLDSYQFSILIFILMPLQVLAGTNDIASISDIVLIFIIPYLCLVYNVLKPGDSLFLNYFMFMTLYYFIILDYLS